MQKNLWIVVAASIAGSMTSAMAHEGDVGLTISGGRLVSGIVDDSGGSEVVIPGQRVFAGEFGLLAPGYSDEPGFFAASGEFLPDSRIGFNVLKAVRVWNGTDFTDLSTSRITLEYAGGAFSVASPVSDVFTAGFSFPVGPDGGFDEHLDMYLNPDVVGIYLLELGLWTTQAGVAGSEPIWMVLNNGADEEQHEAAIEWTEANLVPTPAALTVLFAGAGLMSRRRRA